MSHREIIIDGHPVQRVQSGDHWYWVWGAWQSRGYDELEIQRWTPIKIGEQLCFTARRKRKRFVVLGDTEGTPYDDVYDTVEYHGKPLYIACAGWDWLLVLGDQESQRFSFQIAYRIENDDIWIIRFARSTEYFKPVWRAPQ
jgi:hypothetical protein